MDYAIYKERDGKNPHVVHRFTQEACNHKAKLAAREKLSEMWMRFSNVRIYATTRKWSRARYTALATTT